MATARAVVVRPPVSLPPSIVPRVETMARGHMPRKRGEGSAAPAERPALGPLCDPKPGRLLDVQGAVASIRQVSRPGAGAAISPDTARRSSAQHPACTLPTVHAVGGALNTWRPAPTVIPWGEGV